MAVYESCIRSTDADALFDAILSLKDRDECYRFFDDLCTIAELKSLVQRWSVARQLAEGTTYQQIAQEQSASTATISRVNRSLYYGAGGYRLLLDRIQKTEK